MITSGTYMLMESDGELDGMERFTALAKAPCCCALYEARAVSEEAEADGS